MINHSNALKILFCILISPVVTIGKHTLVSSAASFIATNLHRGSDATVISRVVSRNAIPLKPRRLSALTPFRRQPMTSLSGASAVDGTAEKSLLDRPSSSKLYTSSKIQQTLDPCVVMMKALVSEHAHLWEKKDGIYSLAQGIVYWTPPPTINQQITDTMNSNNNELHTYGPEIGLPSLLSKLQTKLSTENNLEDVSVMVTAGANQAYMNCVLTLLDDDQRGIVFAPYYFNHVMAMQMTRGEDSVLIGPTEEGVPDLSWLERTLAEEGHNVNMVTIVNPGNPTGVSLSRDVLRRIVSLCAKFDVWVVVDNTYEHFDHTGANGDGATDDRAGFYCFDEEHVVNIFSFSKGYSMAGYRVGYLTVSKQEKGAEMFQQMIKVQDTIPISVSRISQVAAIGALNSGREWVNEKVTTLSSGRDAILSALSPLETVMGGSGAMYVMGKLPDGMDDQAVASVLVETYGVAIIPGSFCGYPGWIRVCYSNLPPGQCAIAAARLAEGIKDVVDNKNGGLGDTA